MDPSINPTAYDYHYRPPTATSKIIIVSSIAAGVQFGWALQLSLLTPYIQLLGVPHLWAAIIWLCGPVSGLLVQPIVGYHSDKCTSRWGRRRPFIAAGTALVSIAVFLIGFAADLGVHAGDSLDKKTKPRAVFFFVLGFWILDVANNMLQGPCRALLADLSDDNHKKMRTANSYYSFFMAVGNVVGYGAGSYNGMYRFLPFTETLACGVYCANLKTCFIISICLLVLLTALVLTYVSEVPLSTDLQDNDFNSDDEELEAEEEQDDKPLLCQMIAAIRVMSRPMWILLLVTCFNWIAWFPFLLYDTDWMGKEVYGGKVHGNAEEVRLYDQGVRAGSLGLLLNSVVLAFASLMIEPASGFCGNVKKLWGIVNLILAICLAGTVFVTKLAVQWRDGQPAVEPPPFEIKVSALSVFAMLGIPQAATYTIPFALASIYSTTSGFGQGLSMGLLNMSIVLPQMLVSVVSGLIDNLFGGGNLPSFIMGAIAAAISSFLAFFVLPSPQAQSSPATSPDEHWTDT